MKDLFENWNSFLSESILVGLSSYSPKSELDPEFWSEDLRLLPKIRKQLLRIAEDFLEKLQFNSFDVIDITLTGSLANYNWTDFSDFDLHIILDFKQVDENVSLVRRYFSAKGKIWNIEHNIKISGHEVEIYVQELAEPHASTGVYSLHLNRWLNKPSKIRPKIDQAIVHRKASTLMDMIDQVEKHFASENYEIAYNTALKLRKKIRNFRKCGLQGAGEYSSENLAFKTLRRNGYLRKLHDLIRISYDKFMSIGPGKRDLNEYLDL